MMNLSVLLIILGTTLCLCAVGAYITYCIAFRSPNKTQNNIYNIPLSAQYQKQREMMQQMIADFDQLPFQPVSITSHDGLTLTGRYYHQQDGAPLGIGFHGYRGTAVRDFCGGGKLNLALGYNLLLVNQRAHETSQGHTITFGVQERYDCLDWIQYARDRFGDDVRILLYGISMGASTVLMASGLSLPGNVRGIIADSPFSSPESIIKKVCRDRHMPVPLVFPFLVLGARLLGHFHLRGASAVDAVKRSPVPILLIHGEDDRYVPCEMSREIHRACPEKTSLHTFPGAGHGISYTTNQARYHRIVTHFVNTIAKIAE